MLRSILAVIVGFVVITILNIIAVPLFGAVLPQSVAGPDGSLPATGWIIFNLAYGLIFAAVGGYIAARLAQRTELTHAAALAAVILLLGAFYAFSGGSAGPDLLPPPTWYLVVLPAVGVAGVMLGGWLRARQT
ncbi:MAG: hypothetical protein DWQ07_13745 [Chloroflexi bacterium]|nr:MAG: hypothetical protein DWQ07_13745 [Chloroflexota bacterium]MBL1194927.1 hypothetical protein [Chloroflexota bacterium]NOH12218.1 hypothetical protein [Chloroflexota bacterium]